MQVYFKTKPYLIDELLSSTLAGPEWLSAAIAYEAGPPRARWTRVLNKDSTGTADCCSPTRAHDHTHGKDTLQFTHGSVIPDLLLVARKFARGA